jgi:predicted nucleotidyltransferase
MNKNVGDIGLSDTEIDEILLFTRRFPDIAKVILFGSRAKCTHKRGSDVDIALSGSSLTPAIINEVSYLLNEESTLPYYFDLLNLASITSPALLSHIEEYGVQLNA